MGFTQDNLSDQRVLSGLTQDLSKGPSLAAKEKERKAKLA